ncbi:flagellar biosynthesis protein FliQ [Deltaproteobacteria bacterium OttesenSCG-928-K17]|nr:flagellar biosynthesis protein FliQ [Deltaproteobacteria bacterium OttesenSCG-928-K17]
MTPEFIIDFGRQAMQMVLLLALPMLGVGLVVGLTVSIFQATTSIQEMTLQFIPKIICISLTLVIVGPWMLEELRDFTANILLNFPEWVRLGAGVVNPGLSQP